MKKKHVVILIVILTSILVGFVVKRGISASEANLKQLTVQNTQEVDLTKIPDGVYHGSYKVFPISVIVDVTVSNGEISSIELIKHFNGQGAPAEIIIDRVIEAQSLEVDIVSGATYSSKVILMSIEKALNSTKE